MQIHTETAYQGSVPKADQSVSYTNAKENVVSKVSEDLSDAKIEERKDGKDYESGEPAVSIKSNEIIKKAVSEINQRTNTEAVFGFHDATNRVTIKIIDKESKEVLKEYPPEETLDMIAKVWELAGILVDEKR